MRFHHTPRIGFGWFRKALSSAGGRMLLLGMIVLWNAGCNKDGPTGGEYPKEIRKIIVTQCATSGCHEGQSAVGAGGLNMETWADLFKGSRGGSPVVPFAPGQSYLLFSINTDTALGPVLTPTMPFNETALTQEEYATIYNWIYNGARNKEGEEPFPPNSARKKWYVGHQVCDQVAVFDANSRQIMRYIEVGNDPVSIEYTFDIKVSPDHRYWYVVYFGSNPYISQYSTLTDEKVADIQLGNFGWSTVGFSPDGKFAFFSSEYFSSLQVVDLNTHTPVGSARTFGYSTRGPVVHPARQEVYLADYQDRSLTVLAYDAQGNLGAQRSVDIIQGQQPAIPGDAWPFEIFFLPDGSKYFVTCTHSQEVRVFDAGTDSLLAVVTLPAEPSKMTYSAATGRLFISCMEDVITFSSDPNRRGSIAVLSTNTHQVSQFLYSGYQPYSIYADDANGVLVVTNRNADVNGPQPHHISQCEGRNGYLTLIDLQTLQVIDGFKPELLADPSTLAGF